MLLLTADEIRNRAVAWERQSAIYFLLRDGAIVYVGASTNVFYRVLSGQHTKLSKIDFDAWFWIPCETGDLARLEREYITALDPPQNKDHATRQTRGIRPHTKRPRQPSVRHGKSIETPAQTFETVAIAAAAHGISRQAAYNRAHQRTKGWRFGD